MKNGMHKEFERISWYQNDLLHREDDLPAVEREDGTKMWYFNGELHRDNNLPAVEFSNGSKYWYVHGEPHREDGPAVIFSDGKETWWLYGIGYSQEEFNLLIKKKQFKDNLQTNLEHKKFEKKRKI